MGLLISKYIVHAIPPEISGHSSSQAYYTSRQIASSDSSFFRKVLKELCTNFSNVWPVPEYSQWTTIVVLLIKTPPEKVYEGSCPVLQLQHRKARAKQGAGQRYPRYFRSILQLIGGDFLFYNEASLKSDLQVLFVQHFNGVYHIADDSIVVFRQAIWKMKSVLGKISSISV